ncbi:hypothetical protein CPT_Seuss33 [Caulobacter phage Seuss]|uniref:Uncharacterized protein n=1 Tax=Caulobacter phage Seuss TaxID=1675601 RepID=A0A0K1LM71_9CAUD|nr:virion structural protein [Caulobacter phage Seuss]AKU43559.1 hypothetical protein CPT_Seuss33 [Caulobacter phage Seuss]
MPIANARLDVIETTVGVSPKLQIWTGAQPANCAAAATGTKLAELTLPSDWMANSSAGSKAKAGTWSGTGLATGTAGYWRLTDSAGTTCHLQGNITTTAVGTGDMLLDNTSITTGQAMAVSTFTLTDGNA